MLDGKTLWDYEVGNRDKVHMIVGSTGAAAAAATTSSQSPSSTPATTQDIALEIERGNAEKIKAAAIPVAAATTESSVDAAVLPVRNDQDMQLLHDGIPFTCQWRLAALWNVASQPAATTALVLHEWSEALLGPPTEARLLRMEDDVLHVVKATASPLRGAQSGVRLCPEDPGVLKTGGFFAVGREALDQTCTVCGRDDHDELMLVCDGCGKLCHTYCLKPPLTDVPEGDWFCSECDDGSEAAAAEAARRKAEERRARMPSAKTTKKWGGGVSCIGRSKECTVVSRNHFGKVPGVPVGKHWRYRIHVSEAGVHRPPVSGIHGKATDGCYSICMSGGYEDDIDEGDEFTYTGSGGRDLDGNKRTAGQSKDQQLTRENLSIALNCPAHKGCAKCTEARACDACKARWREGKPVRVCRSEKAKGTYAPKSGIRYDGLYKVVDFWPEKGRSGFIVWRYRFRRDDDEPAPWTEEGKARIAEEGLDRPEEGSPRKPAPATPTKPKHAKKEASGSESSSSDESDESESDSKKKKKHKHKKKHHHHHHHHHHKKHHKKRSRSDSSSESESEEETKKAKKKRPKFELPSKAEDEVTVVPAFKPDSESPKAQPAASVDSGGESSDPEAPTAKSKATSWKTAASQFLDSLDASVRQHSGSLLFGFNNNAQCDHRATARR